jgi:hypothetical protein
MEAVSKRGDSPEKIPRSSAGTVWLGWLQQAATLVYAVAGGFLIYQHFWGRLRQRYLLLFGILFLLYGLYRFFLVRRWIRRH